MTKPLSDDQRDQIAVECADYGSAIFNALRVRDSAGRSAIDRLRDEASGELRAANYNGSGGGSVIPDPAGSAATDHVAWERGNRDDEDRRIGRPDPTRAPEARLNRLDVLMVEIHARYTEAQKILAAALPRPPRAAEVDSTDLEEANRDAGCESCARIIEPSGAKRYRATHRTGRVAAKAVDANERAKGERRRRALLTSADDEADARARLAIDVRLCEPCYKQIRDRVLPGAGLTLAEALPLKVLRDRIVRTEGRAAS